MKTKSIEEKERTSMHYVTAGESHGPLITAIITDVPAGLKVSEDQINCDLQRRQQGFGRSSRQSVYVDEVRVTGGIRFGRTTGAPVVMHIENKVVDAQAGDMHPFDLAPEGLHRETVPRPGHADLVGMLKTNADECRAVMERASARETAARVAASGIAREFLADVGVDVGSYVVSVGDVHIPDDAPDATIFPDPLTVEMSQVRCPDSETTTKMIAAIRNAREKGDTLGGTFRVFARNVVCGLGGFAQGSDRLTSRVAAAIFGVPGIKGVEFGLGFGIAERPGSEALDRFVLDPGKGFLRETNKSGGLEGGMTTGMPLVVTAAMKPIPTLGDPMLSIDLDTLEEVYAPTPRADVCAVPAAAVVAEAELSFVLAQAYEQKFGSDNMADILAAVSSYRKRIGSFAR